MYTKERIKDREIIDNFLAIRNNLTIDDKDKIYSKVFNNGESIKDKAKLVRANNLLKLELKQVIEEKVRLEKELCWFIQRDKILTSLENSLPKRIKAYEKAKAPKEVVLELNKIYELLMAQKEALKEGLNE